MINKQDIELLLSQLLDYEYKDYRCELLTKENIYRDEVVIFIAKYNYIELLEEINEIAQGKKGEEPKLNLMHNRRDAEIDIIIRNSLFYVAIRVTSNEYRRHQDEILNRLLQDFLRKLDMIATPILIRNKKVKEIEDKYIQE